MAITYGDRLIDAGHHDITPEQEREMDRERAMENLEEGSACPFRDEACTGHMRYPEAENCSCHISPPCASCTSVVLTCDECGWEEGDV